MIRLGELLRATEIDGIQNGELCVNCAANTSFSLVSNNMVIGGNPKSSRHNDPAKITYFVGAKKRARIEKVAFSI